MKQSLTILILLLLTNAHAQEYHESVFPDLNGTSLKNALKNKYRPSRTLSYRSAREKMYREIDRKSGKLTCIYTGFSISVSSNASTGEVFNKGINCEHSWPQSKGASGQARSDMHHLFPTRIDVNSARGSLPFAEIDDNKTDRWYRGSTNTSRKPTSDIDSYSEVDSGREFEPREDIKGDVARAAFYFKTMYSTADQSFFNKEVDDLCDWHLKDPVDKKEWERNIKIAKYQQGKKNPFVLDCSLARVYCDNETKDCYSNVVSVGEKEKQKVALKPNPTHDFINLEVDERGVASIKSTSGAELMVRFIEAGSNNIDVSSLPKGMYIISIKNDSGKIFHNKKFIKL